MSKIYISVSPIGVFAIDEKNEVVAFKLFKKDPEEAAKSLKEFESGESKVLEVLKKELKGEVVTEQPNPATEFLQKNMRRLAKEKGFAKNDAELNKFLAAVGAARVKKKISVKERRDKLIAQSVSAVGDLDKILNTMSERLREWYGLHYPEFKPSDHEKFAKAVAQYGSREKFENFKGSMGMSLTEEDVKIFQIYASQLKEMYDLRKKLDKYLEETVPQEMPNTTALLGHILAARLLAHAGSLSKMAKMPSSTIQLLGAEKALFRALKEMRQRGGRRREGRVPKYGILFTHPDIIGAPNEQRGKIARLLSAKVSIAARMDFYSKEDRSEELLKDYKKKVAEVKGKK